MTLNDLFMYWDSLGINVLTRINGRTINIYIFGKYREIDVKNFKNRQIVGIIYNYKFRPKFLYKLYKRFL